MRSADYCAGYDAASKAKQLIIDACEAEIERLTVDKRALAYQVDHFVAECNRWEAENARLQKLCFAAERNACPYWPKCGCGTQSGPHTCEWQEERRGVSA